MPSVPAAAADPLQLSGAQRTELRARLAHHRANPGERSISMYELKVKLLGAGNTPPPPP